MNFGRLKKNLEAGHKRFKLMFLSNSEILEYIWYRTFTEIRVWKRTSKPLPRK